MQENARGKRQRRYKPTDYATPYEKLKSLPKAEQYLKPSVGLAQLDKMAKSMSDTEWARTVDSPLTTMAEPIAEVARKALHMLLTRIADPNRQPETVRLAPRLLHRASCGC